MLQVIENQDLTHAMHMSKQRRMREVTLESGKGHYKPASNLVPLELIVGLQHQLLYCKGQYELLSLHLPS